MNVTAASVTRRILQRCGKAKAVVVVSRNGKPSRVYDLQTYLRRSELTKRTKPWESRRKPPPVNPLGSVKGRVLSSLSRREIYD